MKHINDYSAVIDHCPREARIRAISLQDHGIEYYVERGRLIAHVSDYEEQDVDVTNFSKKQFAEWLGY